MRGFFPFDYAQGQNDESKIDQMIEPKAWGELWSYLGETQVRGFRSSKTVGISSETVGWMCTAWVMVV
jgi:hypothetical protein